MTSIIGEGEQGLEVFQRHITGEAVLSGEVELWKRKGSLGRLLLPLVDWSGTTRTVSPAFTCDRPESNQGQKAEREFE